MTLEKADELIAMHSGLGSGYNRNAARMVFGEIMRVHGQAAVDSLLREDYISVTDLHSAFGTCFYHQAADRLP